MRRPNGESLPSSGESARVDLSINAEAESKPEKEEEEDGPPRNSPVNSSRRACFVRQAAGCDLGHVHRDQFRGPDHEFNTDKSRTRCRLAHRIAEGDPAHSKCLSFKCKLLILNGITEPNRCRRA